MAPDLTAAGLVARLEHCLGRFEEELAEVERRGAAAAARLPGYEARAGAPFPLEGELEARLRELEALDAALASRGDGGAAGDVAGAAAQRSQPLAQ